MTTSTTNRFPRLIPWIATFTILASLISPMLTLAAPADDDPLDHATICDHGYLWNDQTQQCEPPPNIPVVDPNDNQLPECPEGKVPNGNGGCIPDQQPSCPDGQVLDGNGNCIPDLPPPPCPSGMVYDQQGNCVPDPNQQPTCPEGEILSPNNVCIPDPNQQPTCDQGSVFNEQTGQCESVEQSVPPPATKQTDEGQTSAPLTASNQIVIQTYSCGSSGLTAAAPQSTLESSCVALPAIVEFVAGFGGGSMTKTTNDRGIVGWYAVPSGPWFVQETIPSGYGFPAVFCGSTIEGDRTPVDAPAGRIHGTFATTGEGVYCDWYNFPGGGDAYDVHRLSVIRYTCPTGTDTSLDHDALRPNCNPDPDVAFTASWGADSVEKETNGGGATWWRSVPTGPWVLAETSVASDANLKAMCRTDEGDWSEVSSTGGRVEGTFTPADEYITCDWFSFRSEPAVNSNVLSIGLRICPIDVDPTLDASELTPICTLDAADVEYTATYPGETGDTRSTRDFGGVWWGDMPPGPWTVQQTVPLDYSDSRVFCGLNYAGSFDEIPVTGGRIEGTFAAHEDYVHCYWFNFTGDVVLAGPRAEPGEIETTDETGTDGHIIEIDKLTCPAGSSPSLPLDDLRATCTPAPDVEFTATFGGVSSTLTTDASGNLLFNGIPNGPFAIQETIPEGFREPVAFCGFRLSDPGVEPAPVPGGLLEGEFVTPEDLYCEWFNISGVSIVPGGPLEEPDEVEPGGEGESEGGSTITVHKWLCPVEFDFAGVPIEDLPAACPDSIDANFILRDGVDLLMETVGGSVTVREVASGDHTLTEIVSHAFDPHTFVTCSVDDGGPRLHEVTGGELALPTIEHEGTQIVCDWYNVPMNSIHVRKVNCPTGTDPASDYGMLRDACTEPGNGVEFTLDNADGSSTRSVTDGEAEWILVPSGPFTLTETIPPGYGDPVWGCRLSDYRSGEAVAIIDAPDGVLSADIPETGGIYSCRVFNFPTFDRTVTVHKWACPAGTDTAAIRDDELVATCINPMDGVDFTMTDASSSVTKPTVGGTASWYGVTPGEITLTEQTPPGYLEPVVYCALTAEDGGAAYGEAPSHVPVTDGGISRELIDPVFTWTCDFFNVSEGPGEITIHKWTCPAGYDVDAPGADPTVDCTEVTDGIGFILEFPDGSGVISVTGEAGPGTAHFGDLEPGSYIITESAPGAEHTAFVWDCTGTDIGAVHPSPLSRGEVLHLDIAGGDSITCDWYNVPEPEFGALTVIKQQCATATFVDAVDCDTYEHGATFELFSEPGGASLGTATTGASGAYTWTGLTEGRYTLDEVDAEPCHVTISREDGAVVAVVAVGEDTIITVYNCSTDTSTTGTPGITTTTSTGKIPISYPDTGTGPVDDSVSPNLQDTPAGTATPAAAMSSGEFFEIACPDAPITVDGTPAPSGTPVADGACARGAVPAHLHIPDASVNADIEVVEIVDEVMQPPSDPHVAAWYKETARLGEANNTIIAGHLNWWNVPQGVFFHLAELEDGERIEVTGDDGLTYVYEVRWVRQEPNAAPPALEVVGPTGEPSLTLITCGGEWDAANAEYTERTVVRAVQVAIEPTEPEVGS